MEFRLSLEEHKMLGEMADSLTLRASNRTLGRNFAER